MQQLIIEREQTHETSRMRHAGRAALIFALIVLCSALLPAIPILLGVLLIVAVVLDAASEDLRPYVEHLLRIPVARASKRRARLTLAAGAGVLLILSGAVGAATRGHLRSEWEQRESGREVAMEGMTELLDRAEALLAAGDVEGAELVLLDADTIAAIDPGRQEEVDDLLARVRRSGDPEAILAVVIELPQEEFEALRQGTSVPQGLDFGERVLTRRAVELALAQLDEAQRLRARH